MMKAFAVTDVGQKRKINQDSVFVSTEPVGNLPNLFIVADGMGGHNAGDYASSYTVKAIEREVMINDSDAPVKIIKEAIDCANAEIFRKAEAEPDYVGMGTTAVVATIVDDIMYVANVGDSRLYVINDGIKQITRDHSLVEEMIKMGEIDRESARTHPDKNIITRAIGVAPKVEADFFEVDIKKGDYVLMCSDGLTNMVDDDDIAMIVKAGRDVVQIVEELIRVANHNGGKDNIAVVIIEPFADEVR